MKPAIDLVARNLLGQMFLASGLGKLGAGYAATQGYMASAGVPGFLLPLVIALEIGGRLALIAGRCPHPLGRARAGGVRGAPIVKKKPAEAGLEESARKPSYGPIRSP